MHSLFFSAETKPKPENIHILLLHKQTITLTSLPNRTNLLSRYRLFLIKLNKTNLLICNNDGGGAARGADLNWT